MNSCKFRNFPAADKDMTIYPKEKGILLFYDNGEVKELYGREHAIMLQDIGYWYTDNIQDFLLNYSYNGVMVIIFESGTSLVYLPNNITELQENEFINYIDKNVSYVDNKYLEFYVMRCLEKNQGKDEIKKVNRNKRGIIKKYRGKDVTGNRAMSYQELCNYLKSISFKKENTLKK